MTGDTTHFAEYIERNLRLNHIRHHHELRPAAAASWIRRELAQERRGGDDLERHLHADADEYDIGRHALSCRRELPH